MMSEEKRFDIVGKEFVGYTEGYAYIIRDNSIVCEPHRWRQWSVLEDKEDVEDLCDLLNELNDENIILKSELSFSQNQNRELRKVLKDNRSMAEVVERNKELEKENEKLQRRLSLYKMNEDEVDKYLRTHPMPTITNERTIIPLGIRHRCD